MAISVFEMFKVGIGPSSLHTVGPMRAALTFVTGLEEAGVLARVRRVRAQLYGSLGATGQGHGSDKAVMLGPEGEAPDQIDPDTIEARLGKIRDNKWRSLLGRHAVAFNAKTDLVFLRRQTLPYHPNDLSLTMSRPTAAVLASPQGAGVVVRELAFLGHLILRGNAADGAFRAGVERALGVGDSSQLRRLSIPLGARRERGIRCLRCSGRAWRASSRRSIGAAARSRGAASAVSGMKPDRIETPRASGALRPGLSERVAATAGEDTIFLRGVRVESLIGVYEHERHAPQSLVIDLELGLTQSHCCASDDLDDAVDYGQVLAVVRHIALVNRAVLLEAFAQDVADALIAGFQIDTVKISVSKPGIFAAADSVGISIRRRRKVACV